MNKTLESVFRQGSTTYFFSSIFFPPQVRSKIFALYGFVRTVDNFVDQQPQQIAQFYYFVAAYSQLVGYEYSQLRRGEPYIRECSDPWSQLTPIEQEVLTAFVDLKRQATIPDVWIQVFLTAMEADIYKSSYHTLRELQAYMLGSAEVVGLLMARILQLPLTVYPAARMLGRSMQYINILRDVGEDLKLGRQYLPLSLARWCGLPPLSETTIASHQQEYKAFLTVESNRYKHWQSLSQVANPAIPFMYLVPIKTASLMYEWTANQVIADPQYALRHKIKPSPLQVIFTALYVFIREGVSRIFGHIL